MLIQLSKPSVSSQEIKSVEKVILSGYLGMGPKTKEFENDLADFFGRHVVCTSSGTSALHIALQALRSLNKKKR